MAMIASNELRKGNLVKVDGTMARVTQIMWNRVEVEMVESEKQSFSEVDYENLEAIPLTLEILENTNLIKHRRFYYAHVFFSQTGKFTINQLRDNIEISFAVNSTPGIISDRNLNLHELQNLYFALMQEELVINL